MKPWLLGARLFANVVAAIRRGETEGVLKHEFFINGEYRNTIRMCIFQHQFLERFRSGGAMVKPTAQ